MLKLINKYVDFTKKYLLWLLVATVGVLLVSGFCEAIVSARFGGNAVAFGIRALISMAVFGLMLFALIKKDDKLFLICFVVFFAFYFLSAAYEISGFLGIFDGSVLSVFEGIFGLLFNICLVFLAVLYVFDYYKGTDKYRVIINCGSLILLGLQCFVFVFTTLSVFIDAGGWLWDNIVAALVPLAYVLVFVGYYNRNTSCPEADLNDDIDEAEKIPEDLSEERKEEDLKQ